MSYLKVLRIVVAVCAPVVVAGAFVLFRPDWIVAMLARRSPDVVYFAHTEQPVVALTIDDGPDPIATPKILDVLKQHEARATFFLITGRIPGNEGIVARIVGRITNWRTTSRPMSPASGFRHPTSSASCWRPTARSRASRTCAGSGPGRAGTTLPCSRFFTGVATAVCWAPCIPSTHICRRRRSRRGTCCGTYGLARSSSCTITRPEVNARPRRWPKYCRSSTTVASASSHCRTYWIHSKCSS